MMHASDAVTCEGRSTSSLVMPDGTVVACADWRLSAVLAREVIAAHLARSIESEEEPGMSRKQRYRRSQPTDWPEGDAFAEAGGLTLRAQATTEEPSETTDETETEAPLPPGSTP